MGEVVSDRMQKTVIVRQVRTVKHRKYGKFINRTTKYQVHDEKEVAKIGDVIEIEQTRPLSAKKRWRLVRVVRASRGRVRGEKDEPVPGLESPAVETVEATEPVKSPEKPESPESPESTAPTTPSEPGK
jgi:small subunit ribosomal protein S17